MPALSRRFCVAPMMGWRVTVNILAIFGFLSVVLSTGIAPATEAWAGSGSKYCPALDCETPASDISVRNINAGPSPASVQTPAVDLNGMRASRDNDVVFPGFNPEEELLVQAMIQVSYMADQLDLASEGEIDAETAGERIHAARAALTEIRSRWRNVDAEQRIRARARQVAELERFASRLDEAIGAYQASDYRNYEIIQRLRTPPGIEDFLREPPVETFRGVYRSGFEASDFYPLEGGSGPWWLTATGERWAELQSYLVRRPGRGSSVTVALTATGWRETGGEYGGHGGYEGSIYIESIESIRAITPEEFDLITIREP